MNVNFWGNPRVSKLFEIETKTTINRILIKFWYKLAHQRSCVYVLLMLDIMANEIMGVHQQRGTFKINRGEVGMNNEFYRGECCIILQSTNKQISISQGIYINSERIKGNCKNIFFLFVIYFKMNFQDYYPGFSVPLSCCPVVCYFTG